MHGIIAFGAYVPYWRLQRSTIGAALGSGGGKGTRAVASYDEDSTSMGVEAARLAIAGLPADASIATLTFSTSTPPYLDKTNATAIHAALGFDRSVMAADVGGSVRSTVAAMGLGNFAPFTTLTVHADVRTGLPGGADERDGGDGAVAFVWGTHDDALAEQVSFASATTEFLDRWRLPGESSQTRRKSGSASAMCPDCDSATARPPCAAALSGARATACEKRATPSRQCRC